MYGVLGWCYRVCVLHRYPVRDDNNDIGINPFCIFVLCLLGLQSIQIAMKERIEPFIEKLRKAVSSGGGRFAADEIHELGKIWNELDRQQLDPTCGYCVMKMCKSLVKWYDTL